MEDLRARRDGLSALELDPESYSTRALLYRVDVRLGRPQETAQALREYVSARNGREIRDGYFVVLRYLRNEEDLASLKANPR